MGNETTVTLQDRRALLKRRGLTAACSIVRTGTAPSVEEQKRLSRTSGGLGTLPGDPWCDLRAYCAIESPKPIETSCTREGEKLNTALGVTACVRTTIAGKYDLFTYWLIDPDTGCVLVTRGGPSVIREDHVRACAKLAMDAFSQQTLIGARRGP